MLQWIESTMSQMGYPGVSLLMFLETLFPPIPSEVVMPLAGFTAAQGALTWWGVVVAGLIGSTLGMLPLYYLGKTVGERRLKQWIDRYGKPLTLSSDDVDRAKDWLERHGSKAVVLSHVLPGVRSLISIPAGIAEMNVIKFLLLSALGKGMWITVLAVAGMYLGENHGAISQYFRPISYLVIGGVILYVIYWVVRRKREDNDSE